MIDLTNPQFDMKSLVTNIGRKVPWVDKGKPTMETDFGTIFVGVIGHTNEKWWIELGDGCSGGLDLVCPPSWRMPQIMRAMGAFDSAGAAAKNGWNTDIPIGFSQHRIRINKVRGVVTICKVVADV